jgi:DNA polymerase-4
LDISNINTPADEFACSLQEKINKDLGLPCSIGIATNKLVAKIATEVGKASAPPGIPPNAITIVPPGQESEFLAPLPVQMLWGVGPKTSARLKDLNIFTIGELAQCSEDILIGFFGKNGYELSRRSKGIDEQPVMPTHPIKSISKERTFAKDIANQEVLNDTLQALTKEVSHRLRKSKLTARTIRLKLRYANFKTITRQITLYQPTDQLEIIETMSKRLFSKCWSGAPVRLLGIGVSSLTPSKQQLALWAQDDDRETSVKDLHLQEVLEDLQARFGKERIRWGAKDHLHSGHQ